MRERLRHRLYQVRTTSEEDYVTDRIRFTTRRKEVHVTVYINRTASELSLCHRSHQSHNFRERLCHRSYQSYSVSGRLCRRSRQPHNFRGRLCHRSHQSYSVSGRLCRRSHYSHNIQGRLCLTETASICNVRGRLCHRWHQLRTMSEEDYVTSSQSHM